MAEVLEALEAEEAIGEEEKAGYVVKMGVENALRVIRARDVLGF